MTGDHRPAVHPAGNHRPPDPPSRWRRAFATRFGGLPRPFWIIFSGMIANRVGNMVVPFLVFFLGARGISTADTGAVAVAIGAGGLAGPALGGILADRVGRRFTVVLGLVLTPAGLGALFAAPSLVMLAVAGVLIGVSTTIPKPAAAALVSDVVGPLARMRAFSLIHWAINIGTAVASAAAGLLAVRGYWLLFLIDGVTCLVFAGIVLAGIPRDTRPARRDTRPERRDTRPERSAARGRDGYGVVARDRLMVAYLLLSVLGITVYTQTEFAVPLAIRLDGLSPVVFGLVGTANAVLVIVAQPLVYGWVAGVDQVRILVAAWLLIGAGVAATGLADRPWQYVVTVAVWTTGEVLHGMVAGAIVADLAPPSARGRYQGAFALVWAVARLAAPAVASALFSVSASPVLWWGCLAVSLATAAATWRIGGALRTRAAAVRAGVPVPAV